MQNFVLSKFGRFEWQHCLIETSGGIIWFWKDDLSESYKEHVIDILHMFRFSFVWAKGLWMCKARVIFEAKVFHPQFTITRGFNHRNQLDITRPNKSPRPLDEKKPQLFTCLYQSYHMLVDMGSTQTISACVSFERETTEGFLSETTGESGDVSPPPPPRLFWACYTALG